MNKVIQVVTLGADPEIREYGDGKKLVNFSGAVQKRFVREGEDSADWFKYTAFGPTADFIAKYFTKGSKMLIEGEIHNNNYEKDGVQHYSVQITVNNVEFYGKKADGEVQAKPEASAQNKPQGQRYNNRPQYAQKPAKQPQNSGYQSYPAYNGFDDSDF